MTYYPAAVAEKLVHQNSIVGRFERLAGMTSSAPEEEPDPARSAQSGLPHTTGRWAKPKALVLLLVPMLVLGAILWGTSGWLLDGAFDFLGW